MTPADLARKNSISLEAKKDALAQRQNGDWKVSFTVQGTDMDPRLTQAPMGTRYAVVLVEIGDDELPVQQKENRAQPRRTLAPKTPTGGAKRMDWRDMQPAAQAGIRCSEPAFSAFLRERSYDDWDESRADVAECVRLICGVGSRSELGTNQKARVIWHQLDTEYQAWLAKERVGA